MPFRAKKVCLHPGCVSLYFGKGAYCKTHKNMHDYQKKYTEKSRDKEKQAFETSRAWSIIRRNFLTLNPFCADCLEKGEVVIAQEVHHIDKNHLNNDELNMLSLCKSHHSRRTRRGE